MTTLPIPRISQQTLLSWDGSSPNAQKDCGPTVVLAGLMCLLNIKQMDNGEWNPDHILDMAYTEGYQGGTDAVRFVPVCAKYAVKLYPVQGIPGDLVNKIHHYLADGCPCIITEPDPYVPSSRGWTHVLIAQGDAPGTLTFLDPWPGTFIEKSDHEWQELLLNNQIWVMQKDGGEDMSIDINTPGVATEFLQIDASHWRSRKTGKIIQDAILSEFKRIGYTAGWGHPQANEVYYAPGKSRQNFDCAVPGWSQQTGKVELLNLYDGGPGTDPAVSDLEKQLEAAKNAPGLVQNAQAITAIQKIKALVAPF